jgi:site-specific DNA recombinase
MVGEYDRVLNDKHRIGDGVETQHVENINAAEDLRVAIDERYMDNDLSAYSGVERPEYLRLLADIRARKIALKSLAGHQ